MNTSSPDSVAVIPNPAPTPSPEGTPENSPALQCRVNERAVISPEGTAEPTPQPRTVAQSKPTPRKHRPHRSKISDLPTDIRTFVNKSLADHVPYTKICQQLAEKGHPGFNTSNIGRWVKSGHAEWLQKQERVETACLKIDNIKDHIEKFKTNGMDDCVEFNRLMLAAQLTQTMHDFDPNLITTALTEKPGRFYKLARLINTQVLERQRQEKIEIIREKFSASQPSGPTPLGEQAIRLAFGIPDSWSPPGTRHNPSQNNAS